MSDKTKKSLLERIAEFASVSNNWTEQARALALECAEQTLNGNWDPFKKLHDAFGSNAQMQVALRNWSTALCQTAWFNLDKHKTLWGCGKNREAAPTNIAQCRKVPFDRFTEEDANELLQAVDLDKLVKRASKFTDGIAKKLAKYNKGETLHFASEREATAAAIFARVMAQHMAEGLAEFDRELARLNAPAPRIVQPATTAKAH